MKMRSFVAAAKLGIAFLVAQGAWAQAAEVKLLAPIAMRSVIDDLGPRFERESGHKLTIEFANVAALKRKVEAGESFDAAILTAPLLEDLVKQGRIAAGTRADVARSGFGLLIRAGAPKPDIGTADAFKRAMLDARSVAYSKDTPQASYVPILFARLGIEEQMRPKTRLLEGVAGGLAAALAAGEVELAFTVISTVQPSASGIELLGPLPAELQSYIIYSGGVGAAARESGAGKALIDFLKAPAAIPVLRAKGMEPA